jgi:hypothetical protein
MHRQDGSTAVMPVALFWGAASVAAAVLIGAGAITVSPRQAQATPAYAKQTGLPCGRCHVNPAGGGRETAFGKEFAAEGHKWPMPGEKK